MEWTMYDRECAETDRECLQRQLLPDIRRTSAGNVIES